MILQKLLTISVHKLHRTFALEISELWIKLTKRQFQYFNVQPSLLYGLQCICAARLLQYCTARISILCSTATFVYKLHCVSQYSKTSI